MLTAPNQSLLNPNAGYPHFANTIYLSSTIVSAGTMPGDVAVIFSCPAAPAFARTITSASPLNAFPAAERQPIFQHNGINKFTSQPGAIQPGECIFFLNSVILKKKKLTPVIRGQ